MKAQSYEMEALPRRRKTPSVYQFNLVNLVDTQLIQLYFRDSGQRATEVDEEHYLARYIINKREMFARVHFVRSEKFESALKDYDRLHSANCNIFSKTCNEFYEGALSDSKRTKVFSEEFSKEIEQSLWFRLLRSGLNVDKIEGVWIYWAEKEKRAEIMIPVSEQAVAFLNEDEDARHLVANALARHYRYVGKFAFAEDVPF